MYYTCIHCILYIVYYTLYTYTFVTLTCIVTIKKKQFVLQIEYIINQIAFRLFNKKATNRQQLKREKKETVNVRLKHLS